MPLVEGVGTTPVFFKLMARLKFLATSEKQLMMCCRASSVWARRAQSSASSSSVMSSSPCEMTLKGEETAVCSETDVDASGRSSSASWSMMLKKMENNVGARTHPCLTPLEMGKLPDRDPLCFT